MYVIRHGEPEPQFSALLLGSLDAAIDPNWSFRSLVRRLLPDDPIVVSSPLRRATETADLLGVAYTTDSRLREMGLGDWEGQSRTKLAVEHPEAFRPSGSVDIRYPFPGGEPLDELVDRVTGCMGELQLGVVDLVVTHYGTICAG